MTARSPQVEDNEPVIIDQAVYRRGERLPCGDLSDEVATLADAPGEFLWIGLKDPTPDEFSLIAKELDLHPLAVEDALKGGQRPKLEWYGNTIFLVMRTLRYIEESSDVETGEIMVFVGEHFVITVRRGEPTPLEQVRSALEHDPKLLERGPLSVLYSVMDAVVDKYREIDEELNDDVTAIEHRVFTPGRSSDVGEIYALKREILETRWAVQPLIDPARRLLEASFVPKEFNPFFRDVHDHLLIVQEHVDTYDRMLSDVLSAHLAQVSVQQNDDMRKISAWVAIGSIPTVFAALYGMNFHSIPELEASVKVGETEFYYGYYVLLAALATACVLLWRRFKKTGWL